MDQPSPEIAHPSRLKPSSAVDVITCEVTRIAQSRLTVSERRPLSTPRVPVPSRRQAGHVTHPCDPSQNTCDVEIVDEDMRHEL